MITKSLLAAAAIVGAVAFGSAGAANADPEIHFGVGFGFDGSDPGLVGWDGGYPDDPPPPPFWRHRHHHHIHGWGVPDPMVCRHHIHGWGVPDSMNCQPHIHGWGVPDPVMSYGVSCAQGRNIVADSGFHGVAAFDCSPPVYGYTGWKHGEQFRVSVNFRGDIVDVTPIY